MTRREAEAVAKISRSSALGFSKRQQSPPLNLLRRWQRADEAVRQGSVNAA